MIASVASLNREYVAVDTPLVDGPILLAAKPFDATHAPLAVARWLAHREDRELHVVSVYEEELDAMSMAAGAPPLPQHYYEEERTAVAARMREELLRQSTDGVACRVDVESGPSARTIVDRAREVNARLIVIGTGRHDPLGRVLYGERAMQIVRLADRPVLIVPREMPTGAINRAVVAVDFSRASLRATRAAIPMLSTNGELILVHARPDQVGARANGRSAALSARTDELFARFIGQLSLVTGVKVSTKVVWGDVVEEIDRYARSVAADLMVCGRLHTHTLAERVFIGSTSAGLLRRAHCPVLIAPEMHDDARDDAREPLSGVATWALEAWHENLSAFATRNEGRRVRISSEVATDLAARCIAQNYVLRAVSIDQHCRMRLLLTDRVVGSSQLELTFERVSELTARMNIAGSDTHLEFEYAGGRGTLTLNPIELP